MLVLQHFLMTAVGAAPGGSRGVAADTVMDGYFTGRRYLSQTYVRFKFLSSNHTRGRWNENREVEVWGKDLWV